MMKKRIGVWTYIGINQAYKLVVHRKVISFINNDGRSSYDKDNPKMKQFIIAPRRLYSQSTIFVSLGCSLRNPPFIMTELI